MSRKSRFLFDKGDKFGEYKIVKLLGQGGYGDIYLVEQDETQNLYAMKMESNNFQKSTLLNEYQIMVKLNDSDYFPHVYQWGTSTAHKYFIMETLGPSLSNTRRQVEERHFSLATALRIGMYMLDCIKELHENGYVHRDVKPGNFLFKQDGKSPIVLIDFGLTKRYINQETNKMIHEVKKPGFFGTGKYSSLRAHQNRDQSRRDDLTSWVYSMVEMINGSLPWGKLESEKEMYKLKMRLPIKVLFKNVPLEFHKIWQHITNLSFDEAPNYIFIKSLLMQAYFNANLKLNDPFDWEDFSEEKVLSYSNYKKLPIIEDYVKDLEKSFDELADYQNNIDASTCMPIVCPVT